MLKGNKGEWSEVYTLLKLLGETRIFVGDENLNKIPDLLYSIIKILRDESDGHFEYSVDDNIIIIKSVDESFRIPVKEFQEKAKLLLNEIKKKHSATFKIPKIEKFLAKIKCSSLKAKSSKKTDIRIIIHDLKTGQQPELGFSIKSQLGSASTLLNAGKTTNFIYKIEDCKLSNVFISKINSIKTTNKIKKRLNTLLQKKCTMQFMHTENDIFQNNLILIDSLLANILAEIILDFFRTNLSDIKDLVSKIERKNPLNFNISNNHKFYEYKIKKFLTEVALGMMPGKVWDGIYDATGGYLIVKEDGDILSYHVYNKNKFENYLYHNTKLDTASSNRHNFGKIYKKNGDYYFKLNLQIRFIK